MFFSKLYERVNFSPYKTFLSILSPSEHLPATSTWLPARRSCNELSITTALFGSIVGNATTTGIKRTLGLYDACTTQLRFRVVRSRAATVLAMLFKEKLATAAELVMWIVRYVTTTVMCMSELGPPLLLVPVTEKIPIITWSEVRRTRQ